jgi:hypothetical protein
MTNVKEIGDIPPRSPYLNLLLIPGWLLLIAAPVLFVWQVVKYVMTDIWIHVSIVSAFKYIDVNAGAWVDGLKGWGVLHSAAAWLMYVVPFSLVLVALGLIVVFALNALIEKIEKATSKES